MKTRLNLLLIHIIFISVLLLKPIIANAGEIISGSSLGSIAKPLPPIYESNFDKPNLFGIQLGGLFDDKIIIEEQQRNGFIVNPPNKNPIFNKYEVRVNEYKLIDAFAASNDSFSFEECSVRIYYLHKNWFSKYDSRKSLLLPPSANSGAMADYLTYEFLQVKKFDYRAGNTDGPFEYLEDFKMKLSCSESGFLYLEVIDLNEKISLEGLN